MSKYDYEESRELARQAPFCALLMAAMRKAESLDESKLRQVYPEVWEELQQRLWTKGGVLPGD